MKLIDWLLHRDHGTVKDWTPQRAKAYEKQTLEGLGLAGHHFTWSRTIAAKYKRRTSEREKVTQLRRSA